MILFFGAFGGFGAAFLYAMLFMPSKVESGPVWLGALIPGIFLIIGLIGVFAGVRVLLGKPALGKTVTHAGEANAYYKTLLPYAAKPALQSSGYYRLAPESSHRGKFLLMTFVALFWNGIVSVFLVQKLAGGGDDSAPWWFLAIFLLIGLGLIYGAIKSLLRWIMVGETHVDVNQHPVSPGQRLEVLVSQPGNFKIDQVKIDIICEEKASYRQGTDTRTKTEVVREVPVCDLPAMTAREGKVLAHQTAQVPPDAMLSFKASNNEINWMIRVTMVLPGRPDVEQKYPLLVVSEQLARVAAPATASR